MSGILQSRDERAALARWLAARAGIAADGPDAVQIRAPASGWSNETVIATVGDVPVVVRLAPSRLSMFPDYDLDKEWSIISALHAGGRAPVPEPLAEDLGGNLFGRPLFVMGFVDGIVPSDTKPTYAEQGWLVDGSVTERRRFWQSFLDSVAAVHDTDWRTPALQRLAPADGRSSLAAAVDWIEGLHRWSAAPQAEIEAGFARLRETMPASAGPDVLLWGDARPANVLVRDFRIAALLDWELATVGPVEMDVTWFQEMHWMRTAGARLALPEGFPDDDAIAAGYESASGRRLGDLSWYRLLAAVKVAVLLYRHLVVAIDRGAMPAGHPLLAENVATRRLAAMLA
ncbi:MAG: phosphotransferase family protein [Pseudomonadota bacterium]|nr:phosphotransferase family protein [Pseudomonadota bacterium]